MDNNEAPNYSSATNQFTVSGGPMGLRGDLEFLPQKILSLQHVTVRFDALRALDDLSFEVDAQELRCVIGPNGAGKTTMMDVITGKTKPQKGKVLLGSNTDLGRLDSIKIARAGIGRKFQKPTVFEFHTVWQNLELAMSDDRSWIGTLRSKTTALSIRLIDEALALIQLEEQAYRFAGELSHGQKQLLEIGMLLMQKPRLLLLDEPAAGMSDKETEQLVELLHRLRGECSMVVVEHDMAFVAALSGAQGKVTVLADGKVIAEGTLNEVKRDPQVIESYLGR